jgi:hypothetical protein
MPPNRLAGRGGNRRQKQRSNSERFTGCDVQRAASRPPADQADANHRLRPDPGPAAPSFHIRLLPTEVVA